MQDFVLEVAEWTNASITPKKHTMSQDIRKYLLSYLLPHRKDWIPKAEFSRTCII